MILILWVLKIKELMKKRLKLINVVVINQDMQNVKNNIEQKYQFINVYNLLRNIMLKICVKQNILLKLSMEQQFQLIV